MTYVIAVLTANTIANRLNLENNAGETLLEELDADAETVALVPAAPCTICFVFDISRGAMMSFCDALTGRPTG